MSGPRDPRGGSQEGGGPFAPQPTGVRLTVHAQPGAKRTEVSGLHGEALKIRIQAPPLEGRANDELVRFLANALKVPRANVTLVRGEKSRSKVFDVVGITVEQARALLLA